MDPSMERELEQRRQEKLRLVEREMAWESEKHAIALRKLQKRWDAHGGNKENPFCPESCTGME